MDDAILDHKTRPVTSCHLTRAPPPLGGPSLRAASNAPYSPPRKSRTFGSMATPRAREMAAQKAKVETELIIAGALT